MEETNNPHKKEVVFLKGNQRITEHLNRAVHHAVLCRTCEYSHHHKSVCPLRSQYAMTLRKQYQRYSK